MDTYTIEGEEVIEREVKPFGNGGAHITVPTDWVGSQTKLVRKTPGDIESPLYNHILSFAALHNTNLTEQEHTLLQKITNKEQTKHTIDVFNKLKHLINNPEPNSEFEQEGVELKTTAQSSFMKLHKLYEQQDEFLKDTEFAYMTVLHNSDSLTQTEDFFIKTLLNYQPSHTISSFQDVFDLLDEARKNPDFFENYYELYESNFDHPHTVGDVAAQVINKLDSTKLEL